MIDRASLEALVAVAETGSFDGAATRLSVTQSAISQRIKGLEDRIGAPVLIRSQPCEPTTTGARLIRHAQDVAVLESATLKDLGKSGTPSTIRLALNADSLATWVLPALADTPGLLFDLVIDDQAHSASWLRSGQVAAAITSRAEPIQGCDVTPLGALAYLATASPRFAETYFPDGITAEALRRAPSLAFNAKDMLQTQFVEHALGQRIPLPVHHLASTEGFVTATRLGLGWGMNPDMLVRDLITDGDLELLSPEPFQTPLNWQISRMVAEPLKPLTKAMAAAGKAQLHPI
ncbi:MAG: LysR family transcriptional regulator ArgP [Cohaesibacteraceae bacterium]